MHVCEHMQCVYTHVSCVYTCTGMYTHVQVCVCVCTSNMRGMHVGVYTCVYRCILIYNYVPDSGCVCLHVFARVRASPHVERHHSSSQESNSNVQMLRETKEQ